jgi:hypothetical protein
MSLLKKHRPIPTSNDTGFTPAPGYILVEIVPKPTDGKIILLDGADKPAPDEEPTYVLEDSGVFATTNKTTGEVNGVLSPGTRIAIMQGRGLNHLLPRQVVVAKREEIVGWWK